MFRKMPFILVAVIVAVLLLQPFMSPDVQSVLYAISLSIKSLIMFLLPIIIFGLLFKAAVGLAHKATAVIGLILVGVCFSNFIATFLSHYVGQWAYQFDLSLALPQEHTGLESAWQLALPTVIPNNIALFSGIALGIAISLLRYELAQHISARLEKLIGFILSSFTYLIPLFIAGFVVKLQADGVISTIVKDYALIFILIAAAQFTYITLLYLIANKFNSRNFAQSIKNMLPAAITGFSTMSSAAAMPLTIIGAEKNCVNKDLARSVIPATVNIHLMGDCFAIPIFAYAVLKTFGVAEPTLISYVIFAFYFVLAKFSVAAVPGGGILVMLPILEGYLGFNAPMMSLITALYILFDPVITCANVLGNGSFAMLLDKLHSFLTQRRWL